MNTHVPTMAKNGYGVVKGAVKRAGYLRCLPGDGAAGAAVECAAAHRER